MSNFDDVFKVNSLTLNITNQCNLACAYCFEGNKSEERMTIGDAIVIFDRAYKNFKSNHPAWEDKFSVSFFGGEPFLNFEVIKALMDYAKVNKYYEVVFGVTTNLTILTPEMISIIAEHELGIMISIDGLRDVHNMNRCNSYDLVAENVKALQEAGLNYLLSARMTFTPNSVHTMYDGVLSVIEDLGIDVVHPYLTTDCEWNDDELDVMGREWDELFELQISYFKDTTNKRNISITTIIGALTTFYSFNNDNIPCPFGDTNSCLCVGCGGEIQPCHQRFTKSNLREELCLGNILDDEVITKRIMGRIVPYSWNPIDTEYSCETCEAYALCRGCCPSEGIDVRDSFLGVPKVICYLNNTMMKLINEKGKELLSSGNIRNTGIHSININLDIVEKIIDLRQTELEDPLFAVKLSNLYAAVNDYQKLMFPITRDLIADQLYLLRHCLGKEVSEDVI